MNKQWEKGEILRNARRLVQAKGDGALDYAEKKAKRMREAGEEDDQAFWERIATQVDLLIYEQTGKGQF